MYFQNQKFFVAGISKSGESASNFLLKRGAEVYIYDDFASEKVIEVMKKLELSGAIIVTAETYEEAVQKCDILVLSPGIPIDNAIPMTFRKLGKAIIGEEELGALYLRATAIAVTGTNGKTTTVSMVNEVLKLAQKKSVMCGNTGNPLAGVVEELTFDDYAVIEVSSFQLETLFSLRPHIAVVTNITEDHLNRHYNMENYVFLKSKLVRGMRESEYVVLNYDDPRVRQFAEITRAKVIFFSAEHRTDGVYFADGDIYCAGEKVFSSADMQINGMHNVYNALACTAVSYALGIDLKIAAKAICSFKGVRHRQEKVCERNGKTYINDSKGTNVDATLKAVAGLNTDTVILLGGKDKGYNYEPLFENLKQSCVVHAVIYGENRLKLLNAAIKSDFLNFSVCTDFYTAVYIADRMAKSGQTVLLSPASSSFDEFSGYEERGDAFIKAVKDIG